MFVTFPYGHLPKEKISAIVVFLAEKPIKDNRDGKRNGM